jgi:hypothetical protein
MVQFRVVDLLMADRNGDGRVVAADSPEHAARLVLGVDLVRDGLRSDARALVYFEEHDGRGASVQLFSKPDPMANQT